MYLEYYGFNIKPFSLTPDPRFLYLSTVHKRAFAYLTYGLEDEKGFITISGEVGTGKTTLIRTLLSRLPADRVVAHVFNTTVSCSQLLEMIALDFGIDCMTDNKARVLHALNTFLMQQYAVNKHGLLIIDEAQNLSIEALEEIRLLSNLETERGKLLQIILVGQPEIRDKLRLPQLRQLAQRISVSYHLSPLNQNETCRYIKHRLAVAGCPQAELFTPAAIDQIHHFSQGIPRLINVLCDAALLVGYVDEVKQLYERHITTVIQDLDLNWIARDNGYTATSLPADRGQERDVI